MPAKRKILLKGNRKRPRGSIQTDFPKELIEPEVPEILNIDDEFDDEAPGVMERESFDDGDEIALTNIPSDATGTIVEPDENLPERDRGIESIYDTFYRDVGKYPRISADEEKELSRRILEENDREAYDRFVLANLRLAISMVNCIIRRMPKSPVLDYMDVVQEAIGGLMIAVEKFDYKKNVRFSTYAVYWINQKIRNALAKYRPGITVPGFAGESVYRLSKYIDLHRQGRFSEIPDDIKKRIGDLSHVATQTLSISQSLDENEGGSLDLDRFLPDESFLHEESIEKRFFRNEAWKMIAESIRNYHVRENDRKKSELRGYRRMSDAEIDKVAREDYDKLCRHFGVGAYVGGPQTLREIGAAYGHSQEYARLSIERIMKGIASDPNLKLLAKDWGIFGESVSAMRRKKKRKSAEEGSEGTEGTEPSENGNPDVIPFPDGNGSAGDLFDECEASEFDACEFEERIVDAFGDGGDNGSDPFEEGEKGFGDFEKDDDFENQEEG